MRKELFFAHSLLRTGTQQGLARRQLQLGMGSDDLGQALPGWSPGLQLENQQGRLGFRAQGSWSLSRVSSSDVPLSLGEERGVFTVMKMAGGLCPQLSGGEVDRRSSTGHQAPPSTASLSHQARLV